MSAQEFLIFERGAQVKHQFIAGEVFAMPGASPRHNAIVANLVMLVGSRLHAKCRVFPSDLKIHISAIDSFTYPDVSIVCGALEFYPGATDVITNPRVIFEVLSESTERYDRGDKAEGYRSLMSVSDYFIVGQQREHLEHYARQLDGAWVLREAGIGGLISIHSIGIELPVDAVYAGALELPS